jgi:hypothetical protein
MTAKFLNTFLLGADPELVILDPPTLINGQKRYKPQTHDHRFFGWDHNGYVVEPHPHPSLSARTLMANTKKSLDVLSARLPEYRFRGGAYYSDPNTRQVTLGGHVHLDLPTLSVEQIGAMDTFCQSLESLDILPLAECVTRATVGGNGTGYGRKGDIRAERGRVEYRSMCSWLFSRKTSMLCVTGIKLAAIAPETLTHMDSMPRLKSWVETFKGKDDDVDWMLERGYFDSSLEAKPDANVKSVWKVNPDKVPDWIKELPPIQIPQPEQALRFTPQTPMQRMEGMERLVAQGVILSRENRDWVMGQRTATTNAEFHHRCVGVIRMDTINREARGTLDTQRPLNNNF